jgi:ATP-dependent DNA helicase PIF1
VLQLNENIQLVSRGLSALDREELCIFVEWLLRVGSGVEPSVQINTDCGKKYIKILEPLLLPQEHRHLDGLVSFVYIHGVNQKILHHISPIMPSCAQQMTLLQQ